MFLHAPVSGPKGLGETRGSSNAFLIFCLYLNQWTILISLEGKRFKPKPIDILIRMLFEYVANYSETWLINDIKTLYCTDMIGS